MFFKKFCILICIFINPCIFSSEVELDWWQKTVIYEVYPKSFKDSNGDGVGDLKGIKQMIPYFIETGIEAIWLSPIFTSPMVDGGYDISNFTEIDSIFGTMEDFDSLIKTLKSNNIKLILDFVPNHSSNECSWFKKSVQKLDPYTDYYVWRDPKEWINGTIPVPPNNWISVFEGSAWEYNADRKQYYLHEFLVQQPDFNYRSSHLIAEIKKILKFWLDKGVDGFRVDSVMYLYENKDFPNEPVISSSTLDSTLTYYSLNHIYTIDQPETYEMAAEFRELLDSYNKKDGHTRIMLTEAYTNLRNIIRYYGNESTPIAQIPFNFFLLKQLNFSSNATEYKTNIDLWMENMPVKQWPNWVLGNHDTFRISNRFDPELTDGLNMLLLLLPGTSITYAGEEIGMTDTKIRFDQTQDNSAIKLGPEKYQEVSRDPERTPFQWNSSIHSGFSNTTKNTWLPVNPNYYYLNFESQKNAPRSHWKVYRDLIKLRKNNVFLYGSYLSYVVSQWVFAFKRELSKEEVYIVVINLNNEEEYVNLKSVISDLPQIMNVKISSINSEYQIDDKLYFEDTNNEAAAGKTKRKEKEWKVATGFRMRPSSAIVLQQNIRKEEANAKLRSSASLPSSNIILPIILTVFSSYLWKFSSFFF